MNPIKFDHAQSNITLDKAFVKKANVIGSKEYEDLVRLRRDYPKYSITVKTIKKKTDKKRHAGLDYDSMGKYIELTHGADSPALLAFEHVQALAKTQSGQYAYVKKWFLESFPDYDKTQVWKQEIGIQAKAVDSDTDETQEDAA
ncbi:MAG TPA: hypothetical protein P5559_10505 [Candidatus Limiplasma sp.]|nr:hypothetical protein [Candidatus Limiplasma sp.]